MIDVSANRSSQKWTFKQKIVRVFWALVHPLWRLSPRILWGWRRFLLRCFGGTVGSNAHIYPTVRIAIPWNVSIGEQTAIGDRVFIYALGEIKIGPRATISQGAHLCAGSHDWRDPTMPLLKLPIEVGSDVWICADAFIGPGVSVGDGAIVGARAVVVRNVSSHLIVAGNPAREIGKRNT